MSDPIVEAKVGLVGAAVAKVDALFDQMFDQVNSSGSIDPALYAQAEQAGQGLANLSQGSDTAQEVGTAAPGEQSASATPSVSTIVENSSSDASQASTELSYPVVADLPNAAATPPDGVATPASTGNVLLNGAPVVDSGNVLAGQAASSADLPSQATASVSPSNSVDTASAEPMPRESHLMLLEHKLAGMRAKLVNAERLTLDEFEQILAHIRAVL